MNHNGGVKKKKVIHQPGFLTVLCLCLIKQFKNKNVNEQYEPEDPCSITPSTIQWEKSRNRGILQPTCFINRYTNGIHAGMSELGTSILQHILYIWSRRKPSTA